MTEQEMIAAYEREILAADGDLPRGYKDDPPQMQIAKLQDRWSKVRDDGRS